MITKFKHQSTISLAHQDHCNILGLAPDGSLYLEEFYAEEFIAQHQILNHEILLSFDEDAGAKDIVPFNLPANLIIPDRAPKHALNYSGLRFRGLREAEHLSDWILPLSLREKMPLLAALGWNLPAMLLLGIAESHVLAQAQIGDTWLLCRRLRLAYAHEQRIDSIGLPYDYDSREVYLLQPYLEENPAPLHEGLNFAGITLQRPMDLLYHNGQLFVAEGGNATQLSRVLSFLAS